jgi:hypothetical protein
MPIWQELAPFQRIEWLPEGHRACLLPLLYKSPHFKKSERITQIKIRKLGFAREWRFYFLNQSGIVNLDFVFGKIKERNMRVVWILGLKKHLAKQVFRL